MNLFIVDTDLNETATDAVEQSTLVFFDGADYEFVGGGNAANGY